jgi:exodeoxyribonuclease-3
MRIISHRCNGLVSAVKQGLVDWLSSKDADIICLQDVRVREYKVIKDLRFCPEGFTPFYFEGESETKGGVAIWTRHTPKAVMRGLGSYQLDRNGRYIQADFEQVSIVSVLPPAPWETDAADRPEFIEAFAAWLRKIRKKRRHFVFCGDFGVAPRTLDLEKWHKHNNTPGFSQEDRNWIDTLLTDSGYVDAFRAVFANEPAYSWFPSNGVLGIDDPGAWRTDLQLVSPEISKRILTSAYVSKRPFDDRVPLVVDYDIDLTPTTD